MKHFLLTTIVAVVLVGCGESSSELLMQSVREGNVEAVKQHLAAGADVNAKDSYGWPPLHWPAWKGHKETVELLIAK
ncbi:ankyrin repeat domain-containing protein [Verrucomicrobia bacterium]|nr:ankyrin repeat domain-containing protein [Verrucomicrobiota bacterium]